MPALRWRILVVEYEPLTSSILADRLEGHG